MHGQQSIKEMELFEYTDLTVRFLFVGLGWRTKLTT